MKREFCVSLLALCLTLLVSCGGGGGGGTTGSSSNGTVVAASTGTLSISLTDASTTDYQAVYVTISQVAVHRDGGDWEIVSSPDKTVNLLDLVNGVREDLGLATLVSGHYTQMRLILASTPDASVNILSRAHPYANYIIDTGGQSHELKVPSGMQSGIKIVKGFDINENQTTELVLDFDAARSVVKAGNSGKWLLKPTIKVMNTADYSIIQGNIRDEAGHVVAGVLVSAQVFEDAAPQPEDRVQVKAATVSDVNGNYKLFIEPGSYTLVGYKDGYVPFHEDQKVVTVAGFVVDADFSLSLTDVGTLTGAVTISPVPADQEQYATISIRQTATVRQSPTAIDQIEEIEVKSLNVVTDGATFSTGLPVGTYTAVISTFGKTTIVIEKPPLTISKGLDTDIGTIGF